MGETLLLFRTPVVAAWKQMLHILSILRLTIIGSCSDVKIVPKDLVQCFEFCVNMCICLLCA